MSIKVMCVFSGLGKTYVGNKYKNICDLQSSPYRYDYSSVNKEDFEKLKCSIKRIPNPNWPANYIKALKEAINQFDLVLVPAIEVIETILMENDIEFMYVLPSFDYREILLERFKKRGNNDELINVVMKRFDSWSREQKDYPYPIFVLEKEKYLEDLLIDLKLLKEET